MKNQCATFACALLLSACVTEGATSLELDSVARTASERLGPTEVQIEQIVYAGADGDVVSAWGAMSIDPTLVMRSTGLRSGFVSARTADHWLAINVSISAESERFWPPRITDRRAPSPSFEPPVRVPVNLGSSRPMSQLAARVVFTARPLDREQLSLLEGQPLTTFPIRAYVEDHTPGLLGPGLGGLPPNPSVPGTVQMPTPPLPNSYKPNIPSAPDADNWEITQPHEYNVNAARNQCGIAALANSLAYLRDTFDLPVPDYLQKGVLGSKTLPGRLDGYGGRPATNTCVGSGTASCADDDSGGVLNALYGYIQNRVGFESIALRHQGLEASYPSGCAALPDDGPVSNREGSEVTFEWVCDRLANGDAVMLGVYYYDYDVDGPAYPGSPIKAIGGHGVRVYGCGESFGQRFLRILDDDQQDGMVGGDVCTARDGLAWEYWPVADINNDGKLNAKLDLFTQLEYAIAIEAL